MTISPRHSNVPRTLALASALGIVLLLIGLATLRPQPGPQPDVGLACVLCGDLGGPDLVLNVVLFLPLGWVLGRGGMRPLHALGVALAISGAIEFTQLFIPGRSTTLRDVLMNAAGGAIGAAVAQRLDRWRLARPGVPVRLLLAVGATIVTVAATGWLFAVEPSGTPWYAHWSPRQGHLEHWSGRVLRSEVDGRDVRWGRIPFADDLRRSLRDGAEISIDAIAGAPTARQAGILTISDAEMREVLLIGPVGDDLVVRIRRRAARFRFDAPDARFGHLLRGLPVGAPFRLHISVDAHRTCVRLDDGERTCSSRRGTGSAWHLLRRGSGVGDDAARTLDAVTLALLALPAAVLLGSAVGMWPLVAAVTLLAGTAAAARLTGLEAPSALEWGAIATVLAVGFLTRRRYVVSGASRPDGGAAPSPPTSAGGTVPLSESILRVLACPRCRGALALDRDGTALRCDACLVRYPVRDGIPVLLLAEAVPFPADEPR